MSVNQVQTTVTAKVWQAIAQSDIDIAGIEREDMNKLVDLVVDAALEEVDAQLGTLQQQSVDDVDSPEVVDVGIDVDEDEDILWQGRPFLSLTVYYTITNERIRITEGLLAKEFTDVELVRVQSMDHKQSMTERALNVGDIFITSHDSKRPELTLENVKDPRGVHEILRRAVLKAREKYRLSYREEM